MSGAFRPVLVGLSDRLITAAIRRLDLGTRPRFAGLRRDAIGERHSGFGHFRHFGRRNRSHKE